MTLNDPNKYIHRLKDKFPDHYIDLTLHNTHPVHLAFALINLDVTENNVAWNKCLDCGQPYVVSEGTQDGSFCSDLCMLRTFDHLGIPYRNY